MDEPQRRMDNICIMCGDREPMDGREICGTCGKSAKRLGPEAEWLLSEEPERPDWAEEHREVQESGEVFEGERYDY